MDQRVRKLSKALKISAEDASRLVRNGLCTPGQVRSNKEQAENVIEGKLLER